MLDQNEIKNCSHFFVTNNCVQRTISYGTCPTSESFLLPIIFVVTKSVQGPLFLLTHIIPILISNGRPFIIAIPCLLGESDRGRSILHMAGKVRPGLVFIF